MDFGWRFAFGEHPEALTAVAEEDVEGGTARANGWRSVDLPHDFQFERQWDAEANALRGFKPRCRGTYRKIFEVPSEWKGRRVSLDFGGVMATGEVYVNGRRLASNDYGYLGFEVDVSRSITYGKSNVVAVAADSGREDSSRWYTGAGLYRGVRMVVRSDVSVARHGVKVTTPVVNEDSAEVSVAVEVEGLYRNARSHEVDVVLFSPEGVEVARAKTAAPVDHRYRIAEVVLPQMRVDHPALWDVDSPKLYTCETHVRRGDSVLDVVRTRFGIRTIEYGPRFGFKLNGRKVFLQGMSNHHDLGAVGAAAYPSEIARRFRVMKEFGFNAVRCSHNPYSREFYDLADEIGILVVDELADSWSGRAPGRQICENPFQLVTEWVKRDRNHPSVILWSLGNELQHDEKFSGFDSNDGGVTTYRVLDTICRRWDDTRPSTVAMYPAREGGYTWRDGEKWNSYFEIPRLARACGVASFNYDCEHYGEFFKLHPDLVLFQSEAQTRALLGPYFAMDRSRTVGLSYWGAIAYWGESFGWPEKGWDKSFFGHDLAPRPSAYLIRTAFVDEPQVRVAVYEGDDERVWNDVMVGNIDFSENWNRETGSKVRVAVFTNQDEVELVLNGRSLGVKRNGVDGSSGNVILWDNVSFEPGKIEAMARNASGSVVARHALETAGEATSLRLSQESRRWFADGYDLCHFHVTVVDSQGRIVHDARPLVHVTVSGAGHLIALDEGDHRADSLYAEPAKRLHDGHLMAIVRAGRVPGDVTIRCEADGFAPVEATVPLLAAPSSIVSFPGEVGSASGWKCRRGEAGKIVYIPFEGYYESKGGRIESPRFKLDGDCGKNRFYRLTFDAKCAVDGYWWVDFFDATGRTLPDVNSRLYSSKTWKSYDVVVPAHPSAESAQIAFVTRVGACARDVHLSRISTSDAARWCNDLAAELPKLEISVGDDMWAKLPAAKAKIKSGKPLNVVFLGDSIVNDMWCGNAVALIQDSLPGAGLRCMISVRGSTGCWYYREQSHFDEYVGKYNPDLVVIGGISNFQGLKRHSFVEAEDDIVETIRKCREIGAEVVVCTPPPSYEFRRDATARPFDIALTKEETGVEYLQQEYERRAAARSCTQIWDLTTAPCEAIARSGKPLNWFKRDSAHNDDRGKQLIAQTLAAYFRAAMMTGKH